MIFIFVIERYSNGLRPVTEWFRANAVVAIPALCLYVVFLESIKTGRLLQAAKGLPGPGMVLREMGISLFLLACVIASAFHSAPIGDWDGLSVLLLGAFCGKCTGLFLEHFPSYCPFRSRINYALLAIGLGVLGAGISRFEASPDFARWGQHRWSGPWTNPNSFGMLMGSTAVIFGGLLLAPCPKSGLRPRFASVFRTILLIFSILLTTVCLFRSLSRGAVVATALALAYLTFKRWARHDSPLFANGRVGPIFTVLMVGALLLVNMALVMSGTPALLSWVADISILNRIKADAAALAMMSDHPWIGFGWIDIKSLYHALYRVPSVMEPGAIVTNDYLDLALIVGVPGAALFLAVVVTKLFPQIADGNASPPSWETSVCRAACLVYVLSFAFNPGLFSFPTAIPFWILLEMGSLDQGARAPFGSPLERT